MQNVALDAEDAVSLEDSHQASDANCRTALVRFPHISNFSDFRLIPEVRWISEPVSGDFEFIILPGTKNTIGDLLWLRSRGLERWLLEQHGRGTHIVGICGGYQMLGESVEDPLGIESSDCCAKGLGLLPIRTVLAAEKTTRVVNAITPSGHQFSAYEIHLGQTTQLEGAEPFATLADGTAEGVRTRHCTGTYLHGALENPQVLSELLQQPVSDAPSRDSVYETLADWFEANVDRRCFEELYLCR